MKKQPALGRGMGALIPEKREEEFVRIEITRIKPNPYQPRETFAEEALADLAASIKEHGIIEPIIVNPASDGYQIVAGERRFRAAVIAGLRKVPALIRPCDSRQMRIMALVENLQREGLNPIEEARGYHDLISAESLTQEDVAQKVGKDRATVANALRLLRLPSEVQDFVRQGKLSAGHAKALLGLDSDGEVKKTARLVAQRFLSVRQTEQLVARSSKKKGGKQNAASSDGDPNTRAAQEALMRALQTKVEIRRARRGGRIMITFYSEEDLDRIYGLLVRARKSEAK